MKLIYLPIDEEYVLKFLVPFSQENGCSLSLALEDILLNGFFLRPAKCRRCNKKIYHDHRDTLIYCHYCKRILLPINIIFNYN
jgi:ribosomal protein S27E